MILAGSLFVFLSCYDNATSPPNSATVASITPVGIAPSALIVPGSGTWVAGPSMSLAKNNGTSGVVGGKLYVAGAVNNGQTDLQVFDLATNAWTTKASTGGRALAAGAGIGGKFYIAGGCLLSNCSTSATSSVEGYDTLTNTWAAVAAMPTARHKTASAVIDGKWYIAGGQGSCAPCNYQENLKTELEVYDPSTNTWSTKEPMLGGRYSMAGATANGKLYVASTEVSLDGTVYTGHFEVYDPATDVWTTLTAMPTPRTASGLGVLNGILYYVGGYLSTGATPNTVEAYDPATDTWVAVASLPSFVAMSRPQEIDGDLYVVGTGVGNATNAELQVFTPAPEPPLLDAPGTLHAGVGVPVVLPLVFSHPMGADAGPFTFLVRWKHGVNNEASSRVTPDPDSAPVFRRKYTVAGSFSVLAFVTDANTLTASSLTTMVVHGADEAPTAVVSAPTVNEGQDVVLDASASTDPNEFPLTYRWYFDGEKVGTNVGLVQKLVPRGTHTWRLVATNSVGLADTATGTVSVLNVAPTGLFRWPSIAVKQNSAFTLSVTGVKDAPSDVSAGIGVQFNCGAGYGSVSAVKSKSCAGLSVIGQYTVGVKLIDQLGAEREYSATITITNAAPVVTITGFEPRPGYPDQQRVLFSFTDGANDGPFTPRTTVNGVVVPGAVITGTTGVGPWVTPQDGDPVSVRVKDKYGAAGTAKSQFEVEDPTPTWIQLAPTGTLPATRYMHSAVYDVSNDRMIVFGGNAPGVSVSYNDTWVLSNASGAGGTPAWTQLSPSGGPPSVRGGHTAVYDAANNRMIIYSGSSIGSMRNDVWVLSNANGLGGTPTWTQLSPGAGPATRTYSSAVYDATNNRMTIFGGNLSEGNCFNMANDMWVLSNANGLGGSPAWTQQSPTGGPPAIRNLHQAIYDPSSNRMTVLWGRLECSNVVNDIWTTTHANGLGGTPAWTQLSTTAVTARSAHSIIYDVANQRATIFGGGFGYGGPETNEVWVLSHAVGLGGSPTWTQITPAGTPPSARATATAVYNPTLNRMIVFAGSAYQFNNDVWVLTHANGLP